jgi:20S proteasome subunit alpha 2
MEVAQVNSRVQVDPSGSYFPWKATAIGKSATSAKTFLEKRYSEGLELEDAIHIALLTLKETVCTLVPCFWGRD